MLYMCSEQKNIQHHDYKPIVENIPTQREISMYFDHNEYILYYIENYRKTIGHNDQASRVIKFKGHFYVFSHVKTV